MKAAINLCVVAVSAVTALCPVRGGAAVAEDFGYGNLTVNGAPVAGRIPLLLVFIELSGNNRQPLVNNVTATFDSLFFNFFIVPNVNGYFLENSYGKFSWERAGLVGPVIFDANESATLDAQNSIDNPAENVRRSGIDCGAGIAYALGRVAAKTGYNFAQWDANGDGTIQQNELSIVLILNNGQRSAANRPIGAAGAGLAIASQNVTLRGQVAFADQRASFVSICHELSHSLGTVDLYAGNCRSSGLTLMSCTIFAADDDRRTFHLDPWHKMRLGWLRPRIFSLTSGGVATAAASQINSPNTPVILFDPARGTSEYFIVEYRSDQIAGAHHDTHLGDSSGAVPIAGATNGMAIWHVAAGAPPAFHRGAPNLTLGDSGLWNGRTTPPLAWRNGVSTATILNPVAIVSDGRELIFEWFRTSPQGECLQWVRRTDVGSCGDRAGHSLAYDIHRGVTVFFGGDVPGGDEEHYFNETWEYDGALWRRIIIDGPVPPKRAMAPMAYDEVARYMVLAGGETHDGLLKDTWLYRSTAPGRGTWTYAGDIPVVNDLPAERAGASLTFDESSQKLVMIGGATFDNGDEYTHATVMRWNREGGWEAHPGGGTLPALGFRPTFARNGLARHFAAYDTEHDWLVIHGGWQGCYTEGICDPDDDPDENHYFVGLKTNHISVVTGDHPGNNPGRQQGAMVYDSFRRRFVSFGGFNAGSPVPSLDLPLEIVHRGTANPGPYAKVVNSPPTLGTVPHWRTRLGMVYDRARRTTVIYGGAFGQTMFADTWELVPVFPERLRTPAERHEACEDTRVELGAYFRDPGPGYDPNTFQWMKNGQLIPGATSHLLNFPSLTPSDAGQYQYIVTTQCGHSLTQSPPTLLVVLLKPRITTFDATRQDRCPGDAVSWSVTATGEPPLRYQWRKNGIPLAGATNPTLTLTGLQHADTGDYDVQVANRCTTITSPASHLQVGVTIQAQPQSISPNVCGIGSMSVSADGVGLLRYQWRLDGVPIAGEWRENVLGVNASNLTIAPVLYKHEGKYDVIITDDCGPDHAVTSAVARVTVKPGPQWWLRSTNGPSARFGHTMVYDSARRVTVMFGGRTNWGGLYPFNDLWEWDGARWTQRMPATVTNGWTNISAFGWRVAHRERPVQRANHAMAYDSRRGRVVVFGGQSLDPSGNTPVLRDLWEWDGTQWHFRATNGPIERLNPSMTYDERRGRIVLFGGQPTGSGPSDSELVYEWDGDRWHTNLPPQNPSGANARTQSRMTYDSFRGVAVFGPTIESHSHWSFWDWDGIKWSIFPVVHFTDPIVTVLHGTSLGGLDFDKDRRRSTWFGGLQAGTVNHSAFFDGKEWTLLTNSTTTPARRVLPAMAYDSDRRAHVMFGGSPTYGFGAGTNDTWELIAVDKPLLNEQPASQFRQAGETASFTVQAVGPGPLGYQWYHRNTALAGETGDILTISDVTGADAGEYSALVSNACGATRSRAALLTLNPSLQIFTSGNTATLIWRPDPAVVLEAADNVNGPWTVISDPPNPFTLGGVEPAKFFRHRRVE